MRTQALANDSHTHNVQQKQGTQGSHDRAVSALIVLGCIAAMGLVLLSANDKGLQLPPCPFHWLTGLYCPGCGSSRAVVRLMGGDVLGAIRANVLLALALPAVTVMVISNGYHALSGRRLLLRRLPAWGAWGIFAAIMLFWFLRNLPMRPFDWLAPR